MSTGAPAAALSPLLRNKVVFHHEFVYGDAAETVSIPVNAGTYVGPYDVSVNVVTAFDTSGNNASLLIGVTGDTDALMNATSSAIQTISDATGTEPKIAANAEANLNGYLFNAASNLLLTFAPASAGATAGRCIVRIEASVTSNDGIYF